MNSRQKIQREEKPSNFERRTLEFNLVYNELLSSIRDRDTKVAQQKFLALYDIYRKISKGNLSKKDIDLLEKRLKDASGMIPSEKPPKIGMMILLIIGISSIILLYDPSLTGLATYDEINVNELNELAEIELELISYENSVYTFNLDKIPNSISISGIATSEGEGRVRLYLVGESSNPDSYLLITDQKVSEGTINFDNACVETCTLDLGRELVTVAAKVDNARLIIDKLSYS